MMTSADIIDSYSDDVAMIIDKMSRKKDRLDLMRWLDNFDPDDRTSAFDILQRLVFVDDDQLHYEANLLVGQLIAATPTNSVFYFYPIAKYGKSATLVSYFFEHSTQFRQLADAGRAYFMSSEFDMMSAVFYEDTVQVFFDDFLGSGGSFIKSYEIMAELSYAKFRTNARQFAVSIYRMAIAESNIATEYPAMKFLGNTHHKLFDPIIKMFSPDAEIIRQKKLAGDYAVKYKLFVNKEGPHPLGYRDSEAMISFAYSPPNNTLPIVWSSKKKWRPLLPRFGAEIYASVTEYRDRLLQAAAKLEFGLPRISGGFKKVDKKQLNMLLVLSMLHRQTSAPLIAVIVGITGRDLQNIFELAIQAGFLDEKLNILEKGHTALKELYKLVDQTKSVEKIKRQVIDHDIGYTSKAVSGK